MIRRLSAVFAAAILAVMSFVPQAQAQSNSNKTSSALSFPISAAGPQGEFTGTLRVVSFAVENNALVASGIVTGTLRTATGGTSIARMVTMPVATGAATAANGAVAAAAGACGILHLELGPLDLDVLGLIVHLDKVVLDLSAAPGAGNLLGNLLCSITNLLNSAGALSQIATLLNQLLGLLG